MELLAPAGSMEALKAAVENGAAAVYLGGQSFNARANATNFGPQELAMAVRYCHIRGVKVYVTVNVLIHQAELPRLMDYLWELQSLHVDAIIVQDLGVARLANEILPGLEVHASTQMTINNSASFELLQRLNISRVVLARELPIAEIAQINESTSLEVEVFAHGALCFCYSGQCLMSSFIGGRSGNRGQCAQPCRLPYSLDQGEGKLAKHLLSPKDLKLIRYLVELRKAGVSCLKLEGRMKRPEYVGAITRTYRAALDAKNYEEQDLGAIFNRGFTTGYALGNPGKEFITYHHPSHQGILVGQVVKTNRDKLRIRTESDLEVGDGIEVRGAKTTAGFIMREAISAGQEFTLQTKQTVQTGASVYKTSDARLLKEIEQTYKSPKAVRRVKGRLWATIGEKMPLTLTLQDEDGIEVSVKSTSLAEIANKQPLTKQVLYDQLARLGNVPLDAEIQVEINGHPILPFSEINKARQSLVERWETARLQLWEKPQTPWANFVSTKHKALSSLENPDPTGDSVAIGVSVASIEAVQAAIEGGADYVYYYGSYYQAGSRDFLKDMESAYRVGVKQGVKVFAAFDRITNNRDLAVITDYLKKQHFAGVLVPNLGVLGLVLELGLTSELHTDWPLNIYNLATIDFLAKQGVKLVTLSPELTKEQVQLVATNSATPVGIVVHGPQPVMVSEHCALQQITNSGTCLQPCRGEHYLVDRKGYRFPIQVDTNCRMHLFNSVELGLLDSLNNLAAGISLIRVEARTKQPDWVRLVTSLYRQKLAGEAVSLQDLPPEWGPYTRGHYFRGVK